MEKLIRVLVLLSGNRSYSRDEIAERFDIAERSVYRYLRAIENAGFVLDRREARYRLILDNPNGRSLKSLLHFTEEEAYLLYKTLAEFKAGSPLRERLVKKLNVLYDFKALARLEQQNELEWVHVLGEAMNRKRQVVLQQYRSSNSDSIADRKVEPFQFMEDYKAVWCYDTEDKSNKQFKIARMKGVALLSSSWFFEAEHYALFTDAFRMAAVAPLAPMVALLSLKAYNLIIEEYPLTEKYITKEKNHYRLEIPIADYQGIGRFVLGLPGEIEVLEPEGFKDFLREKRKFFWTDRIWQQGGGDLREKQL